MEHLNKVLMVVKKTPCCLQIFTEVEVCGWGVLVLFWTNLLLFRTGN